MDLTTLNQIFRNPSSKELHYINSLISSPQLLVVIFAVTALTQATIGFPQTHTSYTTTQHHPATLQAPAPPATQRTQINYAITSVQSTAAAPVSTAAAPAAASPAPTPQVVPVSVPVVHTRVEPFDPHPQYAFAYDVNDRLVCFVSSALSVAPPVIPTATPVRINSARFIGVVPTIPPTRPTTDRTIYLFL